MKRKVLSLLLLSFFIVKAYSQNSQSEEIPAKANSTAPVSSAHAACTKPTGLVVDWVEINDVAAHWSVVADEYNLLYRPSTDTTWTTVNIVNSSSYTFTGLRPNKKYYFKVQSVCGTVKSKFSAVAQFKTLAANPYCVPIQGSAGGFWINKVSLGAIHNVSGYDSGYGNYTALSTAISAGTVQKITLTPAFPDITCPTLDCKVGWYVYIDYNQNGQFKNGVAESGEKVGSGAGSGPTTIKFTVPSTALNGKTRMRVFLALDEFGFDDPCFSGQLSGEMEDYTVKVTGGTLKAVAENAVAANNLKQNSLNSIAVSPNPVNTSSANLILQAGKAGPVNIKIADLSGRIIRSETINSIIAGRNTYALHNLNLLPGTYAIIAQQGNAVIARTQFIVAK